MIKQYTKPTRAKDIVRKWHIVDLKGKILGRAATDIAAKLIGKNKVYYVPNLDCGDHVVVVNATKVEVTGKKPSQKEYMHFSGYPGGLKRKLYKQIMLEKPERIIQQAVSGMLPKNKLRDSMLKRLYVYHDDKHPYEAKLTHGEKN